MTTELPETRGLSRRTLLTGAGLAAALAALGSDAIYPLAAFAAAPTSAAGAVGLARAQVGKTLGQMQAGPMNEPPWKTYQNEWCACFASWTMRGAGVNFNGSSSALFSSIGNEVTSPQAGDLIWYPNPGHTGIVASVTNGQIATIEGNVPDGDWRYTVVRAYDQPWRGGYRFARPNYQTSEPNQGSVANMLGMTIVTDTQSNQTFAFAMGFIKHVPGAPDNQYDVLCRMTGQSGPMSLSRIEFQRAIWGVGMAQYSVEQIIALSNNNAGSYAVASWND